MRHLFLLLVGLVFPACAGQGVQGLPAPRLLDMRHIVRPSTPNTALAAPSGSNPAPDLVTPPYRVTASRLYDAVRSMALAQPRTYLQAEYPSSMQLQFVVRSRVMNFPDLVAVQVWPDSTLVLWSRSVYGHGDLGVNRARLRGWLAALDRALAATKAG